MRIWMVCETLAEGCAPNVTVLEIRDVLKGWGNEVSLFCPATERENASHEARDVRFVPTIGFLGLKAKYAVYQLSLIISMGWQYLKRRPDYVYSRPLLAMVSPVLMARLMRVPHFLHLSGDPMEQLTTAGSSGILKFLYSVVERVNCRLSSRVIVETQRNKLTYQKRHGLPPCKVIHIPNGVNTNLFKPMDMRNARKEIGIDEDNFCVGFVGNLTKREGTEYFIRAANGILHEVPQALLLIIGDGAERACLAETCQREGVSQGVRFVGRVPYNAVPLHIACMDVCVVPLEKTHFERTGISSLKLREYMACGKPVVGSDIEGVGDILKETHAGFAVAPEDTGEFVQAVVRLARDKELREEMGRNGRRHVLDKLSWETTAARLLQEYEDIRKRESKQHSTLGA